MTEERRNIVEPTPLSRSILCFCAGLLLGDTLLLYLVAGVRGTVPSGHPGCGISMLRCTLMVLMSSRSKIAVRDVWNGPRVAGLICYGLTSLCILAASFWTSDELGRLSKAIE